MNAEIFSLQHYVDENIVNFYEKQNDLFQHSFFDEDNTDTVPIILVYSEKVYVLDGNHRFCAARKQGLKTFSAIVCKN